MFLTSLTRKIQIKTTVKWYFTAGGMAAKANKDKIANDGEHGEKRESTCTVGRNVN